MFRGSITALITPFKDGQVDLAAFEKFVEWQIAEGSHGLVPCGTTGESPTLDDIETKAIFDVTIAAVKASGRKLPVIAGTGSNSTRAAIEKSMMAQNCGADALLVVAPYYNKPTQDGLYAHYKAIHDATELPIVLYNVPGRTVVEISTDTVCRLAELPRIVALKDATADLSRIQNIKSRAGKDFYILSGEDGLAAEFLKQGADGCISVTANVAPRICAEMQDAWVNHADEKLSALDARLQPLHKSLFAESSPAPVKYACSKLGRCSDELRLPLLPASLAARGIVDAAMSQAGLI